MLSSLLKITNTACVFVAGDYGIESFRCQNAFIFFIPMRLIPLEVHSGENDFLFFRCVVRNFDHSEAGS